MHSTFLGSFPRVDKCPDLKRPEFAFIGRSNVGKSSLINHILQRRKLAKVSSTPGKTQMINLIDVDEKWRIADLPGYGYAKLSKKHRASFQRMIENYLTKREQLITTFVLVDARIPPQAIDLDFVQFMGEAQLPFAIVFTKFDKMTSKLADNTASFKAQLLRQWEELPPLFVTSVKAKTGRKDLLMYIADLVEQAK